MYLCKYFVLNKTSRNINPQHTLLAWDYKNPRARKKGTKLSWLSYSKQAIRLVCWNNFIFRINSRVHCLWVNSKWLHIFVRIINTIFFCFITEHANSTHHVRDWAILCWNACLKWRAKLIPYACERHKRNRCLVILEGNHHCVFSVSNGNIFIGQWSIPSDKMWNYLQLSTVLRNWQVLKIIPSVLIRTTYFNY